MGDLGKIIVVTGFEKLPKGDKSPNLATLSVEQEADSKVRLGHYEGQKERE